MASKSNQQSSSQEELDAPAKPSLHTKDQSPGTGDEGQERGGGRRRGKEAQETPEEL